MSDAVCMNMLEISQKLKEPFYPEEIEWRVGSTNKEKTQGIALAYVTNRAIQNRLDEVFGVFGWKNEFREWKGNSQLCGISILVNGEWITKWDGADDSNMEAVKGGLSDAMKRAAYQWGIGRYLYSLENVWVPIVQAGKSYRLKEEPRLPEWALPKGYSYSDKKPSGDSNILEQMKIKWKVLANDSLDGFDEWYKKMKEKGAPDQQLHEILAKRLLDKNKEEQENAK